MSGIGGFGRKPKGYRKRKPLPALIVIGLLGAVATFVWFNAITSTDDINEAIRCEPKPVPPQGVTYEPLSFDALEGTPLTPPDRIPLRVLNASGLRGEAAMTTAALRELGFTRIAEPENDPAYSNTEADCHGQIRFGENGAGAARTMQLIDPCLQLVRDNRKDATVDLAIGTTYNDTRPTAAAHDVLDQLAAWSAENAGTGNSEASQGGRPDIDEQLLEETAPTHC
ncbi:envelope integrity protein Cei [Prauserella muralis]|uniref:envelope integrity protein Cei n=1 Tax=Prauserella muralis TaxID=588067 RepID=UPI0011AE0615|nr:LytR cell envelope-related transcriptional attenuator [Prauserella muralis]